MVELLFSMSTAYEARQQRTRRIAPRTPFKPRRCGYVYDCPRNYTLIEVNDSASQWVEAEATVAAHLTQLEATALAACSARGEGYLKHGGWCLEESGSSLVDLPNGQSYRLPRHHARSDGKHLPHSGLRTNEACGSTDAHISPTSSSAATCELCTPPRNCRRVARGHPVRLNSWVMPQPEQTLFD